MPSQKASRRRKSTSSAASTRKPTKKRVSSPSATAADSSKQVLVHKFIAGLSARFSSQLRNLERQTVEDALQTALSVLPEGNLKSELLKDQAATLDLLVSNLSQGDTQLDATKPEARKRKASRNVTTLDDGAGKFQSIVPCNQSTYMWACAEARKTAGSRNQAMRWCALALNPNTPLELVVEAIDAIDCKSTSRKKKASELFDDETCKAIRRLEGLVRALAVSHHAVFSDGDLAFCCDRATESARTISEAIARLKIPSGNNGVAQYTEEVSSVVGLVLRVLKVAVMISPQSCRPSSAFGDLLLPCVPKSCRETDGLSFVRVLAYYSISVAGFVAQNKDSACAFVRKVQIASTGLGNNVRENRGMESNDDDSDSTSEEEMPAGWDGNDDEMTQRRVVSQHLLTLCAARVTENESSSTEFLFCVGHACFGKDDPLGRPILSFAAASFLAPVCSVIIAHLSPPGVSPPPTVIQFLRRAYASRVEESLRHRHSAENGVSTTQSWDFVGASRIPPALLEFLKRSEAPLVVGETAAVALRALAKCKGKAASIVEQLRSSSDCAPSTLGPLLHAIDKLGIGEAGGSASEGDTDVHGLRGFFIDTGGSAAGESSTVLRPLRDRNSMESSAVEPGGSVDGLNPIEEQGKQESNVEPNGGEHDSNEEASADGAQNDAYGFVLDTTGDR